MLTPVSSHQLFSCLFQCLSGFDLFHRLPETQSKMIFSLFSSFFAFSCLQLSPRQISSGFFPTDVEYDCSALILSAWCVWISPIGSSDFVLEAICRIFDNFPLFFVLSYRRTHCFCDFECRILLSIIQLHGKMHTMLEPLSLASPVCPLTPIFDVSHFIASQFSVGAIQSTPINLATQGKLRRWLSPQYFGILNVVLPTYQIAMIRSLTLQFTSSKSCIKRTSNGSNVFVVNQFCMIVKCSSEFIIIHPLQSHAFAAATAESSCGLAFDTSLSSSTAATRHVVWRRVLQK